MAELACPPDCAYLSTAREHPPAVEVRRQQRDAAVVGELLRDLNREQAGLLLLAGSAIQRHPAVPLQPLRDSDVIEAAAALASTFETAEKGVIYEHRPESRPAERLVADLKALLEQAGARSGSGFWRDAALAFRRIEVAGRTTGALEPGNPLAFLEFLGRVVPKNAPGNPAADDTAAESGSSRLIVP
jgi:hypothetical protein